MKISMNVDQDSTCRMRRRFRLGRLLFLMAFGFGSTGTPPQNRQKGRARPAVYSEGNKQRPASTLVNINNIAMWPGRRPHGAKTTGPDAGTTFPRGITCIYAGVIWGECDHGGQPSLRVGGQPTNYGTVPGRIISRGVKESGRPDRDIYRCAVIGIPADLAHDASS